MAIRSREGGFTLIEVMVVVAIIGIVSAIAVPNYLQWNSKNQLREAANRIQSQLTFARIAAMNRNTTTTVTFFMAGNLVTVVTTDATGAQILPVETLMSHVTGFTGGPVLFSSLGVRTGGGLGAQFITVKNDQGLTYSVQVLPGGKTSWCAAPAPTCGATL